MNNQEKNDGVINCKKKPKVVFAITPYCIYVRTCVDM